MKEQQEFQFYFQTEIKLDWLRSLGDVAAVCIRNPWRYTQHAILYTQAKIMR